MGTSISISSFQEEIEEAKKTRQLTINNEEISEINGSDLNQFPKDIKGLNLLGNKLRTLPLNIIEFDQLTEINLSKNELEEIPNHIFELPQLQKLRCAENKITEIPQSITKCRTLQVLNLYENQIKELPEFLAELSNLKEILISRNYLNISGLPTKIWEKLSGQNDQHIPSLIIDNLYLGSYSSAKYLAGLQNLGITHILTLGDLTPLYKELFNYKIIQIEDNENANLIVNFKMTNAFIDDGIKNGKVLVHCAAGVSRSGATVIGYIMYRYKYSWKESFRLVQKARPCVSPNNGFEVQLRFYDPQNTN